MKPSFKPTYLGETVTTIRDIPLRCQSTPRTNESTPRTNEITHYSRTFYFIAREHDGLKWFEIDRRQYDNIKEGEG